MSNKVTTQVDLSLASISGLAAFTPLLSALSADDVSPLTMVQLENLGSLFLVNGQYAVKVPDLLRRCSSVRLDRLSIMVGWRKGDTASFLAQSAGGQAVALLCFCLINTCKVGDIGSVLSDLSDRILPKSLARSSIQQLKRVAELLAAKLQVIGFGNLLAKEVIRIQKAYKLIDKVLPTEFFDFMTSESIAELYHALSKFSSAEDTVLRISGVNAMAHIMMVVLIMFPQNTMITAESVIIHQGHSTSIFLDVNVSDNENSPTMIRVEQRLDISSREPILVEVRPREHDFRVGVYHFKWECHITDALQIALAAIGIAASDALIEACCNLLLSLILIEPPARLAYYLNDDAPLSLNGYSDLLGSEPVQRCHHVCRVVFGVTPSSPQCDVRSAYSHLLNILSSVTGPASRCTCVGVGACNPQDGWQSVFKNAPAKSVQSCLHRTLWRRVLCALNRGYLAMLVDAGPNATTSFDISSLNEHEFELPTLSNALKADLRLHYENRPNTTSDRVNKKVMDLLVRFTGGDKLALSDGSSTIYPAALNDLRIDIDRGSRYNLYEGRLCVNGLSHNSLRSFAVKRRQKASKPLAEVRGRTRPSCSGEHSHILFTTRETLSGLELRTTVIVQGHSIQLDLYQILCASMGLNDAPKCDHDPETDLAPELKEHAWTTTVAAPGARGDRIAIVQTKDNEIAQLLACEIGVRILLQRRSCLNCAIRYARAQKIAQVIVAS